MPGNPFGMNIDEFALKQAAEEARTNKRLQADPNLPGNIGGYQPGAEWDVFFNALKGKKVNVGSMTAPHDIGTNDLPVEQPYGPKGASTEMIDGLRAQAAESRPNIGKTEADFNQRTAAYKALQNLKPY